MHFAVGSNLQAVMRDNRAFFGEPFDVRRLLLDIADRNKQRKIGVLVARRLDHPVQLVLDIFPDAVAPWLDHHAASDIRVFREVSGADHLLVPLGEIFDSGRGEGGFRL